ncbi:MAG: NAD+ synthase [Anaerolineae bacterium]|nr:NAD+ synthase [Anaerolineae bacterium]
MAADTRLKAKLSDEVRAALDAKLEINTDLARKILTRFIAEEVTKPGFKRAVVGLSGGIDSAATAFLAAEALGPENVLCVRMPYRTSAPDSLADAQRVIDQLGVPALTVEITPMVEPLFARFPDMDNNRRGNVMARARMIVLYDQSAAFGGLVIGTGNKTEILLGYTTLFGDSAAAMLPLGDLYKTQMRQLSRAMGVPAPILDKPPSADLWIGQTDEGELGYTYAEVDRLLYLLVDERYNLDEAIERGFAPAFVHGVWQRVQRNQFKRVPPLVCKISRRTQGHDFLYLRDWGL